MIKREFKDSLFKFIYGREENKKYLLELYNALSGSNCMDENELEITTIESIIYVTRKNDVSFMIGTEMYLLEQQSTINPNMPLRGFMYFSQLYNKHVTKLGKDLYSETLIKIPKPVFYVLYNGADACEDKVLLKLSDAFDGEAEGFEWTATMLNVNIGHNEALLEACKSLQEYGLYVKLVRDGIAKGLGREAAINAAVDEAIRLNLLDGFFKIHRSEVQDMSLTEFNEEEFIRNRREEGFENGRKEGFEAGREEGRAEMQPIIDRMTSENSQQAAEIARQADEIAALRAQVAELQAST